MTAKISKLLKISVESKQVKSCFVSSYGIGKSNSREKSKNRKKSDKIGFCSIVLVFAVNFKICLRIEFGFTFYEWYRFEEISPDIIVKQPRKLYLGRL